MNLETIVAVYDNRADADAAARDLVALGISTDGISQHTSATLADSRGNEQRHSGGFWSMLFGSSSDDDTSVYDRSVEAGSTVLTARVADDQVSQAMSAMERYNPSDIDERADVVGSTATTNTTGAEATAGREKLQLSEESLAVGKRTVAGGTTRIRRFVTERPVEEQVTLHDETVSIDRRPVMSGSSVGAGAFTDKVVEVTESREVPVVEKTARVVEEVVIRKDTTERVETVRDTVRKEDVRVEKSSTGLEDGTISR